MNKVKKRLNGGEVPSPLPGQVWGIVSMAGTETRVQFRWIERAYVPVGDHRSAGRVVGVMVPVRATEDGNWLTAWSRRQRVSEKRLNDFRWMANTFFVGEGIRPLNQETRERMEVQR